MKHYHLKKKIKYDGSQLKAFWALEELNIKGPSIVTWIGPMNIKKEKIVDYEDKGREIKGGEMAHFIIEHFDSQPGNIKLCYHRQRMLIMILKEELLKMGIKTRREGDDLYINDSKLTVSIATASISSMKIHLGINLSSEGTPENIKTIGLKECNLDNKDIKKLIKNVAEKYIEEIRKIEEDITKTKTM